MSIWDVFNRLSSENKSVGKPEYIIVGLGNPGIQYGETRHNAGFMTVDYMAKNLGFSFGQHKFKSVVADASIGGKRCLVMKPETYMNNSGEAVAEAMNFYKIPLENIIVIFDDISLEPSKMRIRRQGSSGGHNGIKSIIALCGGEKFPRIKIGVGKKPDPNYNLADWVLGKFPDDDKKKLETVFENACNAAELIVQGNINDAMNRYN